MKTMKDNLSRNYLPPFLLMIFLISCTSDASEKKIASADKPAPVEVSLFIDKSASVSFESPTVMMKCKEAIREAVMAVRSDQDVLRIYYIHGNTSAASAAYELRLPKLKFKPGSNSIEFTRQKQLYYRGNGKLRLEAVNRFYALLGEPNGSETSGATDVYGFLEKLSEEGGANSKKIVYLFSDGIQTRHFNSSKVRNKTQAEVLARSQVKQILSNYSISKAHLTNTQVQFILPYSAISTRHNQNVSYFWRELLKPFNISVNFK